MSPNQAKHFSFIIFMILSSMVLHAGEKVPFSIDQVVHPRITALKEPVMRAGISTTRMMISSPSEKARKHVQQGFALVHAQWDLEAYRHFAIALKEDPDCLMAYAGVGFALAKPRGEYTVYRNAAVSRMLDLIEADDAGAKTGELERFPKVEKQFAIATANLVSSGAAKAGVLFQKVGEEFPNYTEAILMGIFLSKGNYDINGFATPAQKSAVKRAFKLLAERPDNPLVHSFLVSLLAPAPTEHADFKKQAIPSAKFLANKFPDIPAFQHTLGHFAYRTGDYERAEKAFTKSAELYTEWMKENSIALSDCEGYVKAQCYLADTLYQRGDFEAAMKVAMDLRAIKIDSERLMSAGNQALLWRGYTLPAQLYIARGEIGDMDLAHASLPDRDELKPFLENQEIPSLAGLYIEALSTYIGARKALSDGVLNAARVLHEKTLTKNIQAMTTALPVVQNSSEYSNYYEASRCIAIYDMELSGLIALKGTTDDQVSAPSWFRSAIDRQGVNSMMLPPLVLTPMEHRLAEYFLQKSEYTKAYESYNKGLKKHPNNMASLQGAKKALDLLGNDEFSELLQKQIEKVKR